MKDRHTAEAYIKGGRIVIDLPISVIPNAYRAGIDLGAIEPGFKVTSPAKFAKDVVRSLNYEDEEGTTLIHRLFDTAFSDAIEQGADGVSQDDYDPSAPTQEDRR